MPIVEQLHIIEGNRDENFKAFENRINTWIRENNIDVTRTSTLKIINSFAAEGWMIHIWYKQQIVGGNRGEKLK